MTADILALLESDPATGILAAADEVERMVADFAEPTTSEAPDATYDPSVWLLRGHIRTLSTGTLAAVRRWRGVVERHAPGPVNEEWSVCLQCDSPDSEWPCEDFRETADEARAYLGGAS